MLWLKPFQFTWPPKLFSSPVLLTMWSLWNLLSSFFLSHVLSSVGQQLTPLFCQLHPSHFTCHLLPLLCKASKSPPTQIHLEGYNCNVCQTLENLKHMT
jgi:hypothetical protein